MKKILIYGFGNPGRQDDGLGIMLVERMQRWTDANQIKSVSFDYNYQLNIEDALTISEFDLVIFADASIEAFDGVMLTRINPCQKTEFTMHAMTPEFILHLCQSLYGKFPHTYLLHLKGYKFDFQRDPTRNAKRNLEVGIDILKGIIGNSKDPIESIEKRVLFHN